MLAVGVERDPPDAAADAVFLADPDGDRRPGGAAGGAFDPDFRFADLAVGPIDAGGASVAVYHAGVTTPADGDSPRVSLYRLTYAPDGAGGFALAPDPTYGTAGEASVEFGPLDQFAVVGVDVDPLGRAVVAINEDDGENRLLRFDAEGDLELDAFFRFDAPFALDAENEVAVVRALPDGGFVVAGTVQEGPDRDAAVARFDAGGDPLAGFGANGQARVDLGSEIDRLLDFALTDDGGLVAAGSRRFTMPVGDGDAALFKLDLGTVGDPPDEPDPADPFATLDADGRLDVRGTEAADAIDVASAGGLVLATRTTAGETLSLSFPAADVGSIAVNAGAGDDSVTLAADLDATLLGGDGDDTLTSALGDHLLDGGDGDDVLNDDAAGGDTLLGGAGNDVFDAGSEDGPAGPDRYSGGGGSDLITYGNRSADLTLTLDAAPDDGAAGEGDLIDPDIEFVIGGSGDDVISLIGLSTGGTAVGNAGDDVFTGSDGDDAFVGGDGDDRFVLTGGRDEYMGGFGTDTLDLRPAAAGVGLDLAAGGQNLAGGAEGSVASVEVVVGSDFDDTLLGTDADETLRGGGGDDTLDGGPFSRDGGDELSGGDGDDRVTGFGFLAGGDGDDTITGGGTADGGAGDDRLLPLDGEFVDSDGGDGRDTLDLRLLTGGVTLAGTAGAQADGTGLSASGYEVFVGTAAADALDLSDADSPVSLFGGGGDDTLAGGSADDALFGGDGDDVLTGNAGDDRLYGADGDDTLAGGAGDDSLRAGLGADSLAGGGGDDRLLPGATSDEGDTVTGGAGGDVLHYRESTADLVLAAGQNGVGGDIEVVRAGGGNDVVAGFDRAHGGGGDDSLSGALALLGDDGDDTLTAGDGGGHFLDGGAGDDSLTSGAGNDTVAAGLGVDLVSDAGGINDLTLADAGAGVVLDLSDEADVLAGPGVVAGRFANVFGSPFPDAIVGTAGREWLHGGGGDDTLVGLGGIDVLVGGAGRDRLDAGDADDLLLADGAGTDTLLGGGGSDMASADGDDDLAGIERTFGTAADLREFLAA